MSSLVPRVQGECDARFAAVKDAFEHNFAEQGEIGAALCVYVDGRPVIDVWGGVADRVGNKPWQRDTLVNVYSTTKGLVALCAQRVIDDGLLDLERAVAHDWPEFAAQGKSEITLRMLLGHRAGLAAIVKPLPHEALYDQATIAGALAEQAPLWAPDTKHGYHAQTFGFLVAELVKRVTGKTIGTYLREHIAGPLRADVHLGLSAEHDVRVAKVTRPLGLAPPPGEADLVSVFHREPDSITTLAFNNPKPSPGAVNQRAFRAAEIPSSNAHATASGLARIYASVASSQPLVIDGQPVSVLSAEGALRCREQQSYGYDEVLRTNTRFGLGFMLSQPSGSGYFSPSGASFGHPGMGGSIGFADPSARVGFGYVMNRAGANILVGDRPRRLIDALYACL